MEEKFSQKAKGSVPKFTSFRSQARASQKDGVYRHAETYAPSAGAQTSIDDSCAPEIKCQHRGSRREHHSSRNQAVVPRAPNVDFVPWEGPSSLYLVDKVGDPKNVAYGSLHRHAVPAYVRSGAGSVIGSIPENKIDRSTSGDKAVVLSSIQRGLPIEREKNLFARLNKIDVRKLQIRAEVNHYLVDVKDDFIPLKLASNRKRKKGGDANMSDSSAPSDGVPGHYRSIEGKAEVLDRPDDEDGAYENSLPASQNEDGRTNHDNANRRKRIELVRRTETDPTNVNAWLDLINYHDEMMGTNQGLRKPKVTSAERQSNAEVRIAIYEEAIEKVVNGKDKEHLLLGLMEAGAKVWKIGKLTSKWRSLLRKYSEYLGLWIKYLDYKQSSFSSFRYEEARNIYLDCLDVLQRAHSSPEVANTGKDFLYENQVYVFLRMTLFMREAGFIENSLAAWQAVLEWQMFRPKQFQTKEHDLAGCKVSEALSAFEDFWESEVPRVGEVDAVGWASSMAKDTMPPQPRKDLKFIPEDGIQPVRAWIRSERMRTGQSRAVARTIDEADESDPYRVVLFSDVRGSLIDRPVSSTSFALICEAFLAFCHLPPLPMIHNNECTRDWRRDSFVRNEPLHQIQNNLSLWQMQNADDMEGRLRDNGVKIDLPLNAFDQFDPFGFPMPEYQISSDSLFATPTTWFSVFDAWGHGYSGDRGPVQTSWIRRVFNAFVQYVPSEDYLAEYYLAFESRISPTTAKKLAKGFIKVRPDSLRLYNAFALLELSSGDTSNAENVLITAINMAKVLEEASQRNTTLLWRTWIWELLTSGRKDEALRRLLMYPEQIISINLNRDGKDNPEDPTAFSSSRLLRTQTSLTTSRDHLLSLCLPEQANHHADLLILLTYLTTSSISSAHSTFQQNLSLFLPSSPTHELLHQFFSKLLYHHVKHTPSFSPSLVRSTLAESIKEYPKNTMFLSLHAWVESRFRIDDCVRSIMKDVVLNNHLRRDRNKDPPSIISHFFAVHTELRRSLTLGSNINTIRATFERAVSEDSIGAHSAGLWKLYFCFERERGDAKKAMDVFWRGVRACPWAKELYLLAFDSDAELRMGEVGLRELVQLMEGKELRIHKRIEDFMGK